MRAFVCACAFVVALIASTAAAATAATTATVATAATAANVAASSSLFPLVINTWWFTNSTQVAFETLMGGGSALDAVELGCMQCEIEQCDGTVGYGGSPDESGETTLDALIMDGTTMKSGSVANLRRIKQAISVARRVLEYTEHTMLAGDQATEFAIQNGFTATNLTTPVSQNIWEAWRANKCQPNYRLNVLPDPHTSCGPYKPNAPASTPSTASGLPSSYTTIPSKSSRNSHDTISMVVITADGVMAAGTSTNGASHKIPGRVGDGPITGSGSYVDGDVGGCGATGDGDTMMRFLPCYQAVESMRRGMSVQDAADDALLRIAKKFPNYEGAIVVVDKQGNHAGSAYGWHFEYSIRTAQMTGVEVIRISPVDLLRRQADRERVTAKTNTVAQ